MKELPHPHFTKNVTLGDFPAANPVRAVKSSSIMSWDFERYKKGYEIILQDCITEI